MAIGSKKEKVVKADGNAEVTYHKNPDEWRRFVEARWENVESPVEVVNWFEPAHLQDKRGQPNGGDRSYVISTVSETPKYSFEYQSCTGVVVMGRDRKTGERISILTHQSVYITGGIMEKFMQDLKTSVTELFKRVDPSSLSVGFLGGRANDYDQKSLELRNSMLNEVQGVIESVLGKDVKVINDPAMRSTAVFVDTEAGVVHIAADTSTKASEEEPQPSRRFTKDSQEPIRIPVENI